MIYADSLGHVNYVCLVFGRSIGAGILCAHCIGVENVCTVCTYVCVYVRTYVCTFV